MPQSYQEYSSGLTATTYSVTFKYLSIDDVHALGFDGNSWTTLALDSTAPRDATNKTITLASAPTLYTKIRLYRATSNTTLVDFQNGSRLSEADLDTAYQQGLFVAQEVAEDANTNQFNALRQTGVLSGTTLSNFASQLIVSSSTNGLIDGTNKVFNITAFTPQTSAPEAFVVSIDGVIQSPTDAYSISITPAQITFLGTEAPPSGSKIVIVTGVAAASATTVDDSTIEVVTATNQARVKDGGITPAKLSTTGEYTVAGLTVDNSSADGGQLRLNSQGYNQMYFDNYNGNLRVVNHDVTTGVGNELARLDSNGLLKLNNTSDFSDWWGGTHTPAIFTPHGFFGSNGAYAVSIFSNGYRNSSGGFTSMGVNSVSTATGIDLIPTGSIIFRAGLPSGTSVPETVRIYRDNTNTSLCRMQFGEFSTGTKNFRISFNESTGNAGFYNGVNGSNEVVHIANNNTFKVLGSIQYTGSLTDISDSRLKENVEDLENSLDKISQLNGKSYTMIGDETATEELGFIAQDVQSVFPEIVKDMEEDNDYLGVAYIQLIAPMVEAIKELKSKNESLQARVEELESSQTKIESLEARVEALENA